MLYCAVQCCVVFCFALLSCAVLSCVVLCCAYLTRHHSSLLYSVLLFFYITSILSYTTLHYSTHSFFYFTCILKNPIMLFINCSIISHYSFLPYCPVLSYSIFLSSILIYLFPAIPASYFTLTYLI